VARSPGRQSSRTKLTAGCSHETDPILIERDAMGAERARCLCCGTIGPPVHADAATARRALLMKQGESSSAAAVPKRGPALRALPTHRAG
jgi:hypothetical protein